MSENITPQDEYRLWVAEQNIARREDDYRQYMILVVFSVLSVVLYLWVVKWQKEPLVTKVLPEVSVVQKQQEKRGDSLVLPEFNIKFESAVKKNITSPAKKIILKNHIHSIKKNKTITKKQSTNKPKQKVENTVLDIQPDIVSNDATPNAPKKVFLTPPGFNKAGVNPNGFELLWNEETDDVFVGRPDGKIYKRQW